MLGEAATAAIANRQDDHGVGDGFAVCTGKRIAGEAREKLAQEVGEGVVTAGNYLDVPERRERLEKQKQE